MKKLIIYASGLVVLGTVFLIAEPAIPIKKLKESITLQDQSKKEIKREDLPDTVKKTLEGNQYARWTINKVFEVTASKGTIYYAVEFDYGGGQTTTVNFNENGDVIE